MYSDYDLRILQEERDNAETVKQDACIEYIETYKRMIHMRDRLESRRRIEGLLKETSIPREIAECRRLLAKYPSKKKLVKELADITREESVALAIYNRAQVEYQQAVDKVIKQQEFRLWVTRRYGSVIVSNILEYFGAIELVCRYNRRAGKLNVYFGGLNEPLGPGHAHWVFNRKGWAVFGRCPENEAA